MLVLTMYVDPNLIWPLRTAAIKFHRNAFNQNEDASSVQSGADFKGKIVAPLFARTAHITR
jgi:hypothetical protein